MENNTQAADGRKKNGGARAGSGPIRSSTLKKITIGLETAEIEEAKRITGCKSAYSACKTLILLGIKK